MSKKSIALLFCAVIWPADQALAAQTAVAQAVQRLHLSPQQLLSLRDFLGPVSRGTDVETSGNDLFVLRDAATMAYTGEFFFHMTSDGRLEVDQIGGRAKIDSSRAVKLPLRLSAKARTQAIAALANSDATRPANPGNSETIDELHPSTFLPELTVAAAAATDAIAGNVTQSRAEFWPDGSGWSASVRLQEAPPASPLRIAERFFSPVKAEHTRVWRDSIVEIDGDVELSLADFESRYACAASGGCAMLRPLPPRTGLHVIRWSKSLISAIPPSLMAQLSAPAIAIPAAQIAGQGPQAGQGEPGLETGVPDPSSNNQPDSPNG